MTAKEKIAKLAAWGCDTNGALERMLSDEDFYAQCLDSFAGESGFYELGAQIAALDVKAAFDTAHTLKGVAANLGLNPLYDALCAQVEPLRAGSLENAQAHYATVVHEFDAFLSAS